jgi:hypothetical protein
VDDTVAIALESGTDVVFRLRAEAPARLGAPGRLRRQVFALTLFEIVSDAHRFKRSVGGQPPRQSGF